MIQPHHSVNHFIQQLNSGDKPQTNKNDLPRWLRNFIWKATDHFDPIGGTARAGYVVSEEADRCIVRLFLGETEIVGGSRDGAVVPTAFTFDLEELRKHFDKIERMEWHGLPAESIPQQNRDDATIAVDGTVKGNELRLLINLRSPGEMGPGLKQDPDGTCRPA